MDLHPNGGWVGGGGVEILVVASRCIRWPDELKSCKTSRLMPELKL